MPCAVAVFSCCPDSHAAVIVHEKFAPGASVAGSSQPEFALISSWKSESVNDPLDNDNATLPVFVTVNRNCGSVPELISGPVGEFASTQLDPPLADTSFTT